MSFTFRSLVLFIKIITKLLLLRPFMDLYSLFQALLDVTYVLECRLVNDDFPPDRSESEIKDLIGTTFSY